MSVMLDTTPLDGRYGWDRENVEWMRSEARKRLLELDVERCERCGKKGADCRNESACLRRSVLRNLRDFDRKAFKGLALPRPSETWMVDRGYGEYGGMYHAGGQWKRDTSCRFKLKPYVDLAAMREHYAYEVAMGKAS